MRITASMLYNLVNCPHRVSLDLFEDPADRDQVSAFVQLLWEKGNVFEREVIGNLSIPFTDLSPWLEEEKERATIEAMQRGDELIYSGRVTEGDLLGEPDLLRKQNQGYVAGDIKSGAGEEESSDLEEGNPKKHYAVQLALYTDILERLKLSGGRNPFVWDVKGKEVVYNLDALQGKRNPKTLWSIYVDTLNQTRLIISKKCNTSPACSSTCKLCHWRTTCMKALEEADDLTLIPELGRAKRDAMLPHIRNLHQFAQIDTNTLIRGKKTVIPGIGPDSLKKFQSRARLQLRTDSVPFLKEPIIFPNSHIELFFDVETDPMRDICYLDGFLERKNRNNETEKYSAFFAGEPTLEEEEKAFRQAWKYLQASRPCVIYYYSTYEHTAWSKLQKRYPNIVSEEEIEGLFSDPNTIDLYTDVVRKKTEWPTRDFSIKTLAQYLGFVWRDTDPSGASSIEWYNRWVDTKDDSIRKRILEYNEDDCIATRVLLDGIKSLKIQT